LCANDGSLTVEICDGGHGRPFVFIAVGFGLALNYACKLKKV